MTSVLDATTSAGRLDLDVPPWDQGTFWGRLKYFIRVTDPRNVLVSDGKLEDARRLIELYRARKEPPGTTEEQLRHAKLLYDSAFHPDTGEKQNIIGRMSFQVPGGMALIGCMLHFHKSAPAVVFWQWMNQSFNALVNYTNRNAKSDITPTKLFVAYASATSSAIIVALGLQSYLRTRASPLMQRYVPFAAVVAANCVNIPLMRQSELQNGVAVFDENGRQITESRAAAAKGIAQVVFSRIVIAAPSMTVLPIIMEHLEKYPWMHRIKPLHASLQIILSGFMLTFMVPIGCALYPQKCSIGVETICRWEPEKCAHLRDDSSNKHITTVYFNKGL